ncbi:SIR2 family protein [Paenibacillus puerhi]|uniref:SIR2 family protein n=1 Tax=Paenibacillus puerhi TaxID=2692622 RepID=UPI00135BE018|nr:SIR2 family protein [Paenibacillus puerhi]
MSISFFTQDQGIKYITQLFLDKNLIPIFGSGFTRSCKSFSSIVPDGNEATSIMKQLILENCDKITLNDIEDSDFNETSKYFYKLVPSEKRLEFFRDHFTHVEVNDYRKDFLKLEWPYAYTLNIDDGIERTKLFQTVLPYKKLNRPDTSIRLLYKLHGDALTEVTYKDYENIIFSDEQYLQSITNELNKDFSNNLIGDYSQKNLIFIGCSLKNEPDLKYIYKKIEDTKSTLRIYVTSKEPTFLEASNLEEYGINQVLIVSDYELFYREFIKETKSLQMEAEATIYSYTNPKVIDKSEREEAIELISGTNIFKNKINAFYKGGLHVHRSIIKNLENKIDQNECVVVRGRRFSGKTYLLCSLLERQKKYTTYFFPSTSQVDEELIFNLFTKCQRSLFVFDSNSLSSSAYKFVANSQHLLEDRENKIVISVNSNDNYILDSMSAEMVEIPSFFDEAELNISRQLSNTYGLINRRRNNTNIDYLVRLSEEQKVSITFFDFHKKLTDKERILILLLCVLDKVYLTDAYALGVSPREVQSFIERLPTLIEEIPVDRNETNTHSSYKIVHNSKIALLTILNNLSKNEIIESINQIVLKLKNDRQRYRMYIEVILFDTLNQLFGGKHGAGHLIFQVYESLERKLSFDMHYWLQRAKTIYRLFPTDKQKLDEAYNWAKKSYVDGSKPIRYKAALTTSLICCLLYNLEKDGKARFFNQREAIMLGYEALFLDLHFNYKYINNELLESKKRDYSASLLLNTCKDYITEYPSHELCDKAKKICEKLQEISEGYEYAKV